MADRDKPLERVFRLLAICTDAPPRGAFSPFPEKPKGMHRQRYARLKWKYLQAQEAMLDEAEKKLERWYGPGARRVPR